MRLWKTASRWLSREGEPSTAARSRRSPFSPKIPRDPSSQEAFRAAIAVLRDLPDGAEIGDVAIAAIHAEIAARRVAAAMTDGPATPLFSGLRVRKANLPDWWHSAGSLLLQSPETAEIQVDLGLMGLPVSNSVIVAGAHTTPPRFSMMGDGNLVVLGDRITMHASSMTVAHGSTVLIGDQTTATWMTFADIRNAGTFIVGADCMWASGINFMSDDTHAIRDAETGARLNLRGGRIMLEEHVWIADHVRVMGDARIGAHGVVGATSFVKSIALPPHTISIGRPARPSRRGVTWTRFDEP